MSLTHVLQDNNTGGVSDKRNFILFWVVCANRVLSRGECSAEGHASFYIPPHQPRDWSLCGFLRENHIFSKCLFSRPNRACRQNDDAVLRADGVGVHCGQNR